MDDNFERIWYKKTYRLHTIIILFYLSSQTTADRTTLQKSMPVSNNENTNPLSFMSKSLEKVSAALNDSSLFSPSNKLHGANLTERTSSFYIVDPRNKNSSDKARYFGKFEVLSNHAPSVAYALKEPENLPHKSEENPANQRNDKKDHGEHKHAISTEKLKVNRNASHYNHPNKPEHLSRSEDSSLFPHHVQSRNSEEHPNSYHPVKYEGLARREDNQTPQSGITPSTPLVLMNNHKPRPLRQKIWAIKPIKKITPSSNKSTTPSQYYQMHGNSPSTTYIVGSSYSTVQNDKYQDETSSSIDYGSYESDGITDEPENTELTVADTSMAEISTSSEVDYTTSRPVAQLSSHVGRPVSVSHSMSSQQSGGSTSSPSPSRPTSIISNLVSTGAMTLLSLLKNGFFSTLFLFVPTALLAFVLL